MRLVESGYVFIIPAGHVRAIFVVGRKSRFNQFCEDLDLFVLMHKLDKLLRWYMLVAVSQFRDIF